MRTTPGCIALAVLLLCSLPAAADEKKGDLEGSVELIYRSVSLDGSEQKYDEDFDALDSGARLGNLSVDWLAEGSAFLDYARLDAGGLGGDPFQHTRLRVGRKDSYDLSVNYTRQAYVYDLFALESDLDGARWDTDRQRTDVNLKVRATDKVDLLFRYEDGRRSGSSLFMKDIERQLFLLDTPLDQNSKRYTVGANLELGKVDIVFRHTLGRYDNQFDNSTENDLGLEEGSLASLGHYDWMQSDRGGTDWTSLRVHAPFGERVDLTVGIAGTFFGKEEIDSQVWLDADGTTYSGTCSASGVSCESDDDCEAVSGIPGDVCVAGTFSVTDGFSDTHLEGDSTLVDADLAVKIIDSLDLHLQHRSMDRDLDGMSERDLDGDGVSEMADTRNDYQIDTTTALLDYHPIREVRVRAGYRMIDRELIRNGFLGFRNFEWSSDDDDTVILGLTIRPVSWFRLSADREDGDVTQPLTAVAPQEKSHTRIHASFVPKKEMKIDLAFSDFENRNMAPDFRAPGSDWDSLIEGSTWSASFWHRASKRVDYLFRYAAQEVDSSVGVVFDQADSGAVEPGDSIFDNDNNQFSGRVNFTWADPWKAYVRFRCTESSGSNRLLGDVSDVVVNRTIDQELVDAEAGVTYSFESGIFVGAALRDFDYDDANDLLDYEGQIFTFSLGVAF